MLPATHPPALACLYRRSWGLAAALGVATALPVAAADAARCEVKSRSEAVVVVVCPDGLGPEALRDSGIAACKGRSPCNAWIWTDASKAPDTAPKTDAEMPKAAAREAQAIWGQDSGSLALLRKVRN